MAQGAQSGGVRAASATWPHRENYRSKSQMGAITVGRKQEIAIGIALQTQVLKTCPIHNQLYCDDDEYGDDENMARAFAVAVDLVRQHEPYAEEFHHNAHELTDLLSYTIGSAPVRCPDCAPQQYPGNEVAGERAPAGA
jgi:hypothetical protein